MPKHTLTETVLSSAASDLRDALAARLGESHPSPSPAFKLGPIDSEIRGSRLDARLRWIKADRKRQQDEDYQRVVLQEVSSRMSPHEYSVHLIREGRDGKPRVKTEVLEKATAAMVRLVQAEPVLITGIVWQNLSDAQRARFAAQAGRDIAVDILDMLPPASRDYLTEWQRLINRGSCWNTAGSVGKAARRLIDAGFCLDAIARTSGKYHDGHSRGEALAGAPGSPAFVRTMMGERYLAWIDAVR